MKKVIILLVAFVYVTMMSCKQNGHSHDSHDHAHESEQHSHDDDNHDQEEEEYNHDHSKDEHDHSDHNKEDNHELGAEEHSQDHISDQDEQDSHDHEGHNHEYKTAKVELHDFNEIIKVSGEIQASLSNEIALVATNSGTVHFATSNIVEGSNVLEGQQIFYISGDDLAENNISVKYNQTKAAFEKAKSDYERASQLNQNKIISDKELEKTKSEYLNIKSEYEVISKTYSKGKGTVVAPAKSFLKEFYVEEGQYVEVGEKLACIIKQDKLNLTAEVSQKYLNNLSKIQSATFQIANNNKVYDTQDLNGEVLAYGKSLNSENYYIPVVFEIDYHKELLPGSFAQVFLKGETVKDQIVVPKSALIEEQENFFVYVEEGHDQFEKRHVILGNQDGKHVVIDKGLHKGETIVIEGVYFVKLASMSNELPAHSHSH
jgi:RND family efflux transporter MFP subunit